MRLVNLYIIENDSLLNQCLGSVSARFYPGESLVLQAGWSEVLNITGGFTNLYIALNFRTYMPNVIQTNASVEAAAFSVWWLSHFKTIKSFAKWPVVNQSQQAEDVSLNDTRLETVTILHKKKLSNPW